MEKCAESPIKLIKPQQYHEITIEILRQYNFSGHYEKIADDYWDAYIKVFNQLITRCEKVLNQ